VTEREAEAQTEPGGASAYRGQPGPVRFVFTPNPLTGSPVVQTLHPIFVVQFVCLPIIAVAGVGAFALQWNPALVVFPAGLAGLVVSYLIIARTPKPSVTLTIDASSVRLSSGKRSISFPRDELKLSWEAREWTSPRVSGHNRWTILSFQHGERWFQVGMEGLLAAPSGRAGQPQHIVPETVFRQLASEFGISLPEVPPTPS
jgi:hypothetical protein